MLLLIFWKALEPAPGNMKLEPRRPVFTDRGVRPPYEMFKLRSMNSLGFGLSIGDGPKLALPAPRSGDLDPLASGVNCPLF